MTSAAGHGQKKELSPSRRASSVETSRRKGSADTSQRTGSADTSRRTGSADTSRGTGSADTSRRTGSADTSQRTGSADTSQRTGSAGPSRERRRLAGTTKSADSYSKEPGDSSRSSDSPRSKRKQIVEAAIRVFLQHGYAATTLQKVAEEARVIRATIYSHFADKNELFTAIIEELTVNQLGDDFQQRLLAASPREFVYIMRDFVQSRKQNKEYLALLRTVIGESERFPDLARLYFKTVYSQGMVIAEQYFAQHPEIGVKDTQALTAVVGGSMMAHLIQQELLRGKELVPMDLNPLADTLADLITRAPRKD